ncbi:MAG: hypothetical protein A2X49_14545 [Lentisphaerae bacterium GWF2_52_8]|nr:MAG: hypothetical protein A2X49_14545 [Lentisphaerae bacterium GWF2_52_8]
MNQKSKGTPLLDITKRRSEYLENFISEIDESSLAKYALDRWAFYHASLALGQNLPQANQYFETLDYDPRKREWFGELDTVDWDFTGIAILKTLLDFSSSPLLSEAAKNNLRSMITGWKQPRPKVNKDNNRRSQWPFIHTENHDIMCLTIGLFSALFAGQDTKEIIRQLAKSLSCRFKWGWVEWHSPCYQVHYLKPLLILAKHAPSNRLRKGASDLINLQLAERALLSVNGHLGGPFLRGYADHYADDRHDSYLPVAWLAFGISKPVYYLGEGVSFAADSFVPDPVVSCLAYESQDRTELVYQGTRVSLDTETPWPITYYNTPHISMGSIHLSGYSFQTRYFNILIAADPSKNLRTCLKNESLASSNDTGKEIGQVAQYRNWLVARGTLIEGGGFKPVKVGKWNLYCAGKALCAHALLGEEWHVFNIGDTDIFHDADSFLSSLSLPELVDGHISAKTSDRTNLSVSLSDMSISVNNLPLVEKRELLHDCPYIHSKWGEGTININTKFTSLVLDNSELTRIEDER